MTFADVFSLIEQGGFPAVIALLVAFFIWQHIREEKRNPQPDPVWLELADLKSRVSRIEGRLDAD
ncbi:MAG: hypothetical protein AAF674_19695 [Pseudomonadota bacterium]